MILCGKQTMNKCINIYTLFYSLLAFMLIIVRFYLQNEMICLNKHDSYLLSLISCMENRFINRKQADIPSNNQTSTFSRSLMRTRVSESCKHIKWLKEVLVGRCWGLKVK